MVKIKDYSQKSYHNPHSGSRHQRGRGFMVRLVFLCLPIGVVAGMGWFVMTDRYEITAVHIDGLTTLDSREIDSAVRDQMSERRYTVFSQKHIYFFGKNELGETLKKSFPVDYVSVKKEYPGTLMISIIEKEPAYVWIQNEKGFYVDQTGLVMNQVDQEGLEKFNTQNYNILRHKIVYSNLPIIYSFSEQKVQIKTKTTNQAHFNFIQSIIQLREDKNLINMSFYEYKPMELTLVAHTIEGWTVLFNLNNNPADQMNRLEIILGNRGKIGKILDYIDLRFEDKVFYK